MTHLTEPLVGISTRSLTLPGRCELFFGAFASYVECIERVGGAAVLIPPGNDAAIDHLGGLILAGGEDLANPSYWSAGAPEGQVDAKRDEHEIQLIRRAKARGVPVLGLCRGAQLVNCALGGSIARQTAGATLRHTTQDGDGVTHKVSFANGTALASIYPAGVADVVSRHRARIDKLGTNLIASAWAEDGSVEGVECSAWPFVGVQWHPEWRQADKDRDLAPFRWLVDKALLGAPK